MGPRICPNRRGVKWLSASWRMKYRACRIRRPPIVPSWCTDDGRTVRFDPPAWNSVTAWERGAGRVRAT
jgi:hypothetical protein